MYREFNFSKIEKLNDKTTVKQDDYYYYYDEEYAFGDYAGTCGYYAEF
tara:strand:+ start:1262 stop:1405 length:144 start_codon:yes stop_codon:yes gene_type:complete